MEFSKKKRHIILIGLHIEMEKVSRQAGRNYEKSPYVLQKKSLFLGLFEMFFQRYRKCLQAWTGRWQSP